MDATRNEDLDDGRIDRTFLRFRERGSSDDLAKVFDELAPKLLLLAGHLTRDAGRAEDLVQTTFLQAMRDAHRYDAKRPVAAWLAGILRNRAIDERRRADVRRGTSTDAIEDDLDGGPDPAELVGDAEVYDRVVAAVLATEEPYRAVLNLRIVHGLAPTAIAHALGRKPGTVRMQLKRGLEDLRRAVPAPGLLLAFGDGARGLDAVRDAVLEAVPPPAAPVENPETSGPTAPTTDGWDEAASTLSPAGAASAASLGGILTMKTFVGLLAAAVLAVALSWFARDDERVGGEAAAAPGSTEMELSERDDERLASAASVEDTPDAPRIPLTDASPPAAPVGLAIHIHYATDGTPARDVGVYLRNADGATLGLEGRTDEAGRLLLTPPATGTFEVHVDRLSTVHEVRWPEESLLSLTIPAGLHLTGRVIDLDHEGVAGATVYRHNTRHHDLLQRMAVTDEEGAFELRDVEDDLELLARAPLYQPSELEEVRGRNGVAPLQLQLGANGNRISGRVLLPGGDPAAHAWVMLGVDEDAREEPEGSDRRPGPDGKPLDLEGILLRADAAGRFTSDEAPGGFALVLARSAPEPDAVPMLGWTTQEVSTDDDNEWVVHLDHGAEIRGVVRDRDGLPVPDVAIEAEWEGSNDLGQMEDDLGPFVSDRHTVSSEDGSFVLAGLLPGDYDLRIRGKHAELAREERILGLGERAVWEPVIERPYSLAVRVLGPDGTPMEGWAVRAEERAWFRPDRHTTRTDANGLTNLADLPAGRDLVVAAFPPAPRETAVVASRGIVTSDIPAAVRTDVRITPGDRAASLTIQLRPEELPSASVRGLLPAHVGRARIDLTREGWDREWSVSADRDGSFAFRALAPGEVVLRARTQALPGGFEIARLTLAPGDQVDLGQVLVPEAAPVSIHVVATDGSKIGNLSIELVTLEGGAELASLWDRTGNRFTASAPIGQALLRVQGGEFAPWCEPVHVPAAGVNWEVQLTPVPRTRLILQLPADQSGSVIADLTIRDERGLAVVDRIVSMSFGAAVERTARLGVHLGPGEYHVAFEQVEPAGKSVERVLRVTGSGEDEITLDLR